MSSIDKFMVLPYQYRYDFAIYKTNAKGQPDRAIELAETKSAAPGGQVDPLVSDYIDEGQTYPTHKVLWIGDASQLFYNPVACRLQGRSCIYKDHLDWLVERIVKPVNGASWHKHRIAFHHLHLGFPYSANPFS